MRLVEAANAEAVIIDSIKDAAVRLSDDETGGNVNRAIQSVIAQGVEVMAYHHQRKAQGENKKPKKLDDVYGSTWLTAGMGSIIVLWGAAGDPVIELLHLKQPAAEVGPLTIIHDATAGKFSIDGDFDVLIYLRAHPAGVKVLQVAVSQWDKANPSKLEIEKTRRKLERLVSDGLAKRDDRGRDGGHEAAVRYYPAELSEQLGLVP
jgi:replicative DNA helicase